MILLLVLVNGVFAGAEIAIVGVDRLRLRQLLEEKRRGARVLERLRSNPERFLATVQVAITVAAAAAAAFGGATLAEDLEPWLQPSLGRHAQLVSVALVVGLVSYLSLVLGELVPKSLALRHSERYALSIAPVLDWIASAARPLVWILTKSSNLILGPIGDRTNFTEGRLSPAELRGLVEEATETGTLDERVADIASRALGFAKLTVGHVMVPRTRIVGIRRGSSMEELRRIVLEHPHSRLPVYKDTIDDVIGYVLYKDLLPLAWEGRLIVLEDLIRPPHFVAKSLSAIQLLEEMRARQQHLATVLDEHGGTAGIVTLDDLIDELTGEALNELQHDKPSSIAPQADGSILVRGDTPLHEINHELELKLSGVGQTTIGGLCQYLAAGVPSEGTLLEANHGTRLKVERASKRTVDLVRILPEHSS
ncbi:MAG TPA: hemolysin family protein [Polyangiaceae bacterium]|nr:hemolysin family protein [Polyangiaceae bacterium]